MLIRGGTERNQERETLGWRLAGIARMMGTPLIPWQRHVADVACEIDPETGTFFYDTVVISTPRQCGKSALVDASDTFNASLGRRRRIAYAAQTGKDAEDHFKEYAELIQGTRLNQKIDKFRFSNGGMNVTFTNGSTITPMAMTKVAGHGKQMDKVTIDEAFSLTKEAGDTIMDAIIPTMNTRLKHTGITAQRWITSTEGNSESTYFNPLLDGLRSGDVPQRTCWFDFGIPSDADPEDLDVVMRYHPAAGYLWYKPQLRDFRESFGDNTAGWARAFGNRRDMGVSDRVIDPDLWESSATAPVRVEDINGRPLVFAAAVDVDATTTSVSVGIVNPDGTITTQLLKTMPGTGDAPEEITRLCTDYAAPLVMDSKGPNGDLYDRLTQLTDSYGDPLIRFVEMSAGDYLTVGQSYVSGLQNHTVLHAIDGELDMSVAMSARTWSGDAWRITRRGSTGLTSPLESCMLAAWGAVHRPEDSGPLQIY
ncbi:hypothetical protein [Bifidobacterium cebidarum]|uniref:Terminase n=1 Tax=Bifidobacterium cebidarum TaxID=2650773 RepID=A0A6I1GCU6_9BIFI|nr:hypothetical protein [Bifidobacterium cebidarum]KAB7789454.1 hypothetical protein F7D08_0406 [Bifidobacterium cebidarum]